MAETAPRTRFAPSPTGALHLGNARTALLNWLFARRHGGAFVIRSEDTDAERSTESSLQSLLQDLGWLGIDWDEGPDRDGTAGPYRQSERAAVYRRYLDRLTGSDDAYPCFCTREELEAARRRQLAAGKPPRYPGTCAALTEREREERRAAGREPVLRFRVPASGSVRFDDCIHGRQTTRLADIGDFVITRPDGTPAFLFANAVDDAEMGITHVLRGDDHLANVPRQQLLLDRLGLEAPAYGHFPLILGPDGKPLSKRHGVGSLADLRAAGYLPIALVNHMARLGYRPPEDGLMQLDALAASFELDRVGRAGARHDPQTLDGWQRRAVESLDSRALWAWMQAHAPADGVSVPVDGERFARAVQANVTFPADAWGWARRLFDPDAGPDRDAGTEMAAAGPVFFREAAAVTDPAPTEDFAGWAKAVGRATGQRGRSLYRPLRAAITGAVHGPELAEVVALMDPDLVYARLRAAGAD